MDLQTLPPEIANRSLSQREIVLSEHDAMLALDHWKNAGTQVLGWEVWLKYPDGTVGHPPVVLGTSDVDGDLDSIEFCRTTIREAAARWVEFHDPGGREMYFCITPRNP